MMISETYVNATAGYTIGESGEYEPFTEDIGVLFRALQRDYGRCVSRIYIDPPAGGPPKAVGWVFQGKDKYTDSGETYLREVWVTLYTEPTSVRREHHYHELKATR